jgi:hypothetical protein
MKEEEVAKKKSPKNWSPGVEVLARLLGSRVSAQASAASGGFCGGVRSRSSALVPRPRRREGQPPRAMERPSWSWRALELELEQWTGWVTALLCAETCADGGGDAAAGAAADGDGDGDGCQGDAAAPPPLVWLQPRGLFAARRYRVPATLARCAPCAGARIGVVGALARRSPPCDSELNQQKKSQTAGPNSPLSTKPSDTQFLFLSSCFVPLPLAPAPAPALTPPLLRLFLLLPDSTPPQPDKGMSQLPASPASCPAPPLLFSHSCHCPLFWALPSADPPSHCTPCRSAAAGLVLVHPHYEPASPR